MIPCLICDIPGWAGPQRRHQSARRGYDMRICPRCEGDGYAWEGEPDGAYHQVRTPEGKVFAVDPERRKTSTERARTKRLRRQDHPSLPGTEDLFHG